MYKYQYFTEPASAINDSAILFSCRAILLKEVFKSNVFTLILLPPIMKSLSGAIVSSVFAYSSMPATLPVFPHPYFYIGKNLIQVVGTEFMGAILNLHGM